MPATAWDEAEKSLRKNSPQEDLADYQKTLEIRVPAYVEAMRKAEASFRSGDYGAAFHWYLVAKGEWEGSELAQEGLKSIAAGLGRP